MNLLWLRNMSKEGVAMIGMEYDRNEKYANGIVEVRVRLMVRGGILSVRGSNGMEIR